MNSFTDAWLTERNITNTNRDSDVARIYLVIFALKHPEKMTEDILRFVSDRFFPVRPRMDDYVQ